MSPELRRARNRQMVIFLLVCAGMLILSGRLYYWQLLKGPDLAQAANKQHTQSEVIYAPRGQIYDSRGLLLANNIVRDDVYVNIAQLVADYPNSYGTEREKILGQLHAVLPAMQLDTVRKLLSRDDSYTIRVAISITPEQSQKLRQQRVPYTFLQPRTWRNYPSGDLAAQTLGFVQTNQDGLPTGIYGIERKYNQLLSGKAGGFSAETDLNGNFLTVGSNTLQDAVKGADLTLTLDSFIQYKVQTELAATVEKMQAQGGSVVVLNARTGAVVALAGFPSFDPNSYGTYASDKGCLGSLEVYSNPALYCAYEPGSVMKAVTMAVALDQKVVKPEDTINDPGYLKFSDGTQTVTNWQYRGYGRESMTQILENSSNVGAAWLAYYRLGAERYYPYLERFGFAQRTGLLDPEASGGYRTPQSSGWSKSDLARQAFGQSILATPLQVARAYQALANDGVLMAPTIVSSINDNGRITTLAPRALRTVVRPETARTVALMLESTAKHDKVVVPGYRVAIKTGTATTQGLSDTDTEASMAGFLPVSNPQYVILVKIDRPKANIYGTGAAGPLWQSIAQQLMWRYGVPPDQK